MKMEINVAVPFSSLSRFCPVFFPVPFSSAPVLIRYVERNPLRARLVDLAEDWKWGSAWRRLKGSPKEKKLLDALPTELPEHYSSWLNVQDDDDTLLVLRNSVNKGTPYGTMEWVEDVVKKYDLRSTLRGTGRPKKN